ncbi:MAG: hypothetical protein HDP34_01390 [Clostridia bacterium]|nr:hypothetical protein [Clostridia bacterium]
MAKTMSIDLGADRLIAIACDMVDNHNYIGALKMLNKNAELDGNDEDSYMLYAEIFDDMGLYEKCINGWFKYMDVALADDLSECYEGLAVNFMNLGNEHFSAFYYNKLLFEADDIDAQTREGIVKDFMSVASNPLKFAYPPRLADVSDIISSGIDYMKSGEFEVAAEEFDKIDEENDRYLTARNYIAMCKIIDDKSDEAEQECLNILKKRPDDVQALTTLAAVKTEAGKREEALELAKKLLTLKLENNDDIYKIATVCCENKLHAEAYATFLKLTDELENDLNIMYFKAVSAFNCGKYEESFAAFDRLVTIYPEAVTARFYYNAARAMVKSGEISELSYFYRLPQEVRESSLKMLAAYMRLSKAQARKLAAELDLSSCVKWCFDECEVKVGDLQYLAAQVAIKANLDDIVRDLLLNAFLPDRFKLDVLSSLAERNEFNCFGVVICNVYKRVTTQMLGIGADKRKSFLRAYARLVAHFSILDDEHGKEFAAAAEDVYQRLSENGKLAVAKDTDALCAVIYIRSGVREADVDGEKINSFFEVTDEKIKKITGEL